MNLCPRLRYDHCRSIMLGEPEIFVREFVRLIAQTARHDRAHLVKPLERFADFPSRSRFDGLPILLNLVALVVVASERWVLPTDPMQLHRLHAGMALDGKQGVRSLD